MVVGSIMEAKPGRARRIEPKNAEGRQTILAELVKAGREGRTVLELEQRTGMPVSDVVSRMSELGAMGLVVKAGHRRSLRWGRCAVWSVRSAADTEGGAA